MPNLDEISRAVEEVYAMPPVLDKILKSLSAKDPDLKEVIFTLKHEPVFSARLLRIANSAYYGALRVHTIEEAVVRIGSNSIREMAIQTALKQMVDKSLRSKTVVVRKIWQHSVSAAVCGRIIARESGEQEPESWFTAGILHDIGLMLEYLVYPGLFGKVEQALIGFRDHLVEIEEMLYGFNHTQTGELFGIKWCLPGELIRRIRWHHQPDEAPDRKEGLIMWLADMTSRWVEQQQAARMSAEEESGFSELGLVTEQISLAMPYMISEYHNALNYFD